jgi:hypothetical protein
VRVSENRVLRSIFGLKWDKVVEGWTKLYNKELHNLYFSANIIRMIKPQKMGGSGHVGCMGEARNA